MEGYLGIDVGSTNVKAAVFGEEGEMRAFHSEKTPITHLKPGWSEIDADHLWECVKVCLKCVAAESAPAKIVSIGVSSMGESGTLIDENGSALYPFIAWYDLRADKEYQSLEAAVGADRLYYLTGQIPSQKYGISKLLWLKKNEGGLYKKAMSWLSVEDWILFRLTGICATDYSIASRTMAFDIHTLRWSEEILQKAEISPKLFPAAYPGGHKVGLLQEKVRTELAMECEVTVVTGGHDHACASIAVDIQKDGVVLDSMGTAEVSMIALDKLRIDEQTRGKHYSIYPHCGEKLYRVLTSNQSCGVCIEWLLDTWGKSLKQEAEKEGKSKYEFVDRLIKESKDTKGLFFFPFLRGSVENSKLRGVLWGMEDTDGLGDDAKAIMEGLCFELKKQIEGYQEVFAKSYDKIRVVGGISKSDAILQCKSNIQQAAVESPSCTEAAVHGAALLGAAGAGKVSQKEIEKAYCAGKAYRPDENGSYEKKYQQYLELRKGILSLYSRSKTMCEGGQNENI